MDPATLVRTDVAVFLAVGLLAGAHCVGMCGPLVTVYASKMGPGTTDGGTPGASAGGGPTPTGRRSHLTTFEVRQHALFNLGRAASYTTIGAAFGALGGAAFLTTATVTTAVQSVRGGVGIVTGALVVAVGLNYALGRSTPGVRLPGAPRVIGWLTARVERYASGPGIIGLGAVHGLLPCPVLYPAYLYAFATGSPTAGAVALAALGIGTIPTVFAYGTVIESIDPTRRRRVHRLLGLAFVVLGYILVAHGLMSLGIRIPHPRLPFYDAIDVGAHTAMVVGGGG
ncbi:MAG: hypothetical protein A07HR60_00816 [uncultured archaeon A07HR60]|nr:MAG: hypothetical protein A07HR60_00816 [uncultured archaeon A07HR60]